ncbi:MAG: hypothetical protein HYV26_17120 [Candidatus Hydrogenedentes bacterium]|nr:hypothetical protein [Candidatus Hydrogenedentota bacterium]
MATRMLNVLALLLLAATAHAQDVEEPPKPEGLNINIFVNYGAAYREGTWAPVDVIVRNDQEDISGFVEVKLLSQIGTVKSPIYRVPAESPQHSLKRFRFYCKMDDTARVEVQLYHGKRAVLDFPSWIGVTPIRPQDFLCLVLDEHPEDYSFLSTTLYREERGIRFYRESLAEEQLALLADRLICYEPFDLIVLGDINPALIGEQHRQLLETYVRRGGVLAVFTGAHAEKYRGTWVEPLMGVGIGAEAFFSEADLAARLFPGNAALQAGAKPDREGVVSSLTPTDAAVQRAGTDPVLASKRPFGSGVVAGFAIESAGMMLQDCTGYHALWRDLIRHHQATEPLNYANLAMSALPAVPQLAGVELFPVSSIILYLLLYFVIAIVANWLFWNYWKRREWAWVCLVFFSIGFTAYAMIYGTQGRANRTELEQFDLLRLPEGNTIAEIESFVGILSEGSARYAGKLLRDDALVEDVSLLENRALFRSGGPAPAMYSGLGERPFQFIQDTPPVFSDLYIGASDLRFVRTTTYLPLNGGIEGQVEITEAGPKGELINRTGLRFHQPVLLVNGRAYQVSMHEDRLRIEGGGDQYWQNMLYQGRPGGDNSRTFGAAFVQALFSDSQQFGTNTLLSPHLVAELAGPPLDILALEDPAARNLSARYLLAEVSVMKHSAQSLTPRTLPVKSQGRLLEQDLTLLQSPDRLQQNMLMTSSNTPVGLEISVPPWLLASGHWDLSWTFTLRTMPVSLAPARDTPASLSTPRAVPMETRIHRVKHCRQ